MTAKTMEIEVGKNWRMKPSAIKETVALMPDLFDYEVDAWLRALDEVRVEVVAKVNVNGVDSVRIEYSADSYGLQQSLIGIFPVKDFLRICEPDRTWE